MESRTLPAHVSIAFRGRTSTSFTEPRASADISGVIRLHCAAARTTLLGAIVPATAQATYDDDDERPVTVYFTRHAEKKTTTTKIGDATTTYELDWNEMAGTFTTTSPGIDDDGDPNDGIDDGEDVVQGENLDEVCGESKCAEELNALGLKRAELLAKWFKRRGITRRVDAVYSSNKYRTYQTVEQIAKDAGTTVVQLPGAPATELQPESTSPSECLTLEAIADAAPGDTLVVAGHSGTLYDIMGDGNGTKCEGLGLSNADGSLLTDDSPSSNRFPKDAKFKVANFGDVFKVEIYPSGARFAYRVNLQPKALFVDNYAR